MPTEKQAGAARANGARSKGPVTRQGKQNSSRNSIRHGLLARSVVLEEESLVRFHQLLAALMEEFQPATPTQLMLVENMAVARWRLLRVWGAQKTAMDRDMALQDPSVGPACVRAIFAFRGSPESSCSLDLLLRYEIAYDRQFSRALTRLRALQAAPPGQPEPFHPEFPGGHTWKERQPHEELEKNAPAKRTPQVIEKQEAPAVKEADSVAQPSPIRVAPPAFPASFVPAPPVTDPAPVPDPALT